LETLETKEIESAVEAILFASGEPVQTERICVALELERSAAEQALQRLMDYYAYERRGIRLLRVEDSWQLCSAPDYADAIRRAFEIRKPAKLSQPALEVLTIIAYYQPTTRTYVDQIRGVDSAYTMSLLLDRKLIEECGRLQVPGRPHLYRTTSQFLRAFHLTNLEDLPDLPDFGVEGQMRINENGEIVDAEAEPEEGEEILLPGEDVPEP
jgi:segregation and condensation protein B